jgi:hypothetical protein
VTKYSINVVFAGIQQYLQWTNSYVFLINSYVKTSCSQLFHNITILRKIISTLIEGSKDDNSRSVYNVTRNIKNHIPSKHNFIFKG